MFGTKRQTSYGLNYIIITPNEWKVLKPLATHCDWTDYDIRMIDIHIMNCGYGILDAEYQRPIDNEYDLEEIYSSIESLA
jgi:hypothetical protein